MFFLPTNCNKLKNKSEALKLLTEIKINFKYLKYDQKTKTNKNDKST